MTKNIDKYACTAYYVGMSKLQYTIRNVPPSVDRVIRKRSQQSGKSFNRTVVELLTLQAFGSSEPPPDDNFAWLFNQKTLDASFDEAVDNLSQVDQKLWHDPHS